MFLRLPATPSASQGLPVSSRCSPDPIPSLTLHHFCLALSQGCCQYPALALGAALTCHCSACACTLGGAGVAPWSVEPSVCYFGLAGVESCLVHRSHWCFLERAVLTKAPLCSWDRPSMGLLEAGKSPTIPGACRPDVASPHRALAAQLLRHIYLF